MVQSSVSGACFLSPMPLRSGDIISLRVITDDQGDGCRGGEGDRQPPFHMVTSEVVRCDPPAEVDLSFEVGVRHLFRYY